MSVELCGRPCCSSCRSELCGRPLSSNFPSGVGSTSPIAEEVVWPVSLKRLFCSGIGVGGRTFYPVYRSCCVAGLPSKCKSFGGWPAMKAFGEYISQRFYRVAPRRGKALWSLLFV